MVTQIQPRYVEGERRPAAFDIARTTCENWGVRQFEREVVDHFRRGLVVAMPRLFLLAKAIELPDGRRAWFITHAIGNLQLLISMMPFPLEWIVLRRRFDQRNRIYRLDRFVHLANILAHPTQT